jgi:spoIIIJ-associated protein
MARREITSEGKDVAQAIIRGLNELGRRRDQVEVTVVQEEKSGFLGIGGRKAVVKIIEKKWDSDNSPVKQSRKASPYMDEPRAGKRRSGRKEERKTSPRRAGRKERAETTANLPKAPKENEPQKLPCVEIQNAAVPSEMREPLAKAKENLAKILEYMGVKAENLNVWWDAKQQRILLTFDCDHPAVVIGKEGRTLESIQYLITLMVSRDFENPISVMADTQNYWRKLEDKIDSEISKAVSMVKRTRRPYRFLPMPAQVRRYVHRFFAEGSGISTASEGDGKFRKVVLRLEPKNKAEAEAMKKEEQAEERDVARSKVELTPINWDDLPGGDKAVAPAGQPASAADAPVTPSEVGCEVTPVAVQINELLNSDEVADKSGVVSADNAGESCVLTAETTGCEGVANIAEANPAADKPAHTNTGSGVAGE